MKTVEVSQSALESLQKMVEQLQGERDSLLELLSINLEVLEAVYPCIGQEDLLQSIIETNHEVIAKYTAKPEVLE